MSTELIKNYQVWAGRGYVERLYCPSHHDLDLVPIETVEGLSLVCPKMDHRLYVGAAMLLRLERKIEMAKRLLKET